MQNLLSELEKARVELNAFEKIVKKSESSKSGGGKDAKQLMQALESASSRLEGKIQKAAKDFEQVTMKVEAIRNQLDEDKSAAEIEKMRNELDEIKFVRTELLKSAKSLLVEVKAMGEKTDAITGKIRAIQQARNVKTSPQILREEVEEIYGKAVRDSQEIMNELQNNLMVVRKQVQDYSQTAYQYQNIKAHLNSIQTQYSRESGELDKMLTVLEEAQGRYMQDLQKSKESLGGQKAEYDEMVGKAKRIELVLDNIHSLKAEGKKLSTKLKGLMMESQVVDMAYPGTKKGMSARAGRGRREVDSVLPQELVQKINLSAEEEKAFDKKRQELRWLIHKMSKQDRSPSGA
ncbi:MAG: hypothetical protein ABIH83_03730 [Candidatus Micrarchaeota archaeon]